jgi:isopentenyldiphosphate isomerase/intracellular septation protein A
VLHPGATIAFLFQSYDMQLSRTDLIRKMLPGLLPILIFIVVDEIWGTMYGLVAALLVALFEMGYSLLKGKRPDRFVLVDLILLMGLGGVSLLLDNDLFFKIKPGAISLLLTAFIGVSAYSGKNLLWQMSQRYLKDVTVNPYQMWTMRESMKRLFWIFLVYSILVLGAAFLHYKRVWSFVAGPGMFVVMGLFMAMEWVRRIRQGSDLQTGDWVPLVNEGGKVLGQAPRKVVHQKSFLLHPVVHLHVLSSKGILLQKRPNTKTIQPGKWDTAVGGHVDLGESIEQALMREAQEEIGIQTFKPLLLKQYVWESKVERELVFSFYAYHEGPFVMAEEEVEELRFWPVTQIEKALEADLLTPNFIHEWPWLKSVLTDAGHTRMR